MAALLMVAASLILRLQIVIDAVEWRAVPQGNAISRGCREELCADSDAFHCGVSLRARRDTRGPAQPAALRLCAASGLAGRDQRATPALAREPAADVAFVLALIFALREEGLLVTAADAHAAAALIKTQASWPRDDLLVLLGALLVRRAADRPIFEAAFARLYDVGVEAAPTPAVPESPILDVVPLALPAPPPMRWQNGARRVAEIYRTVVDFAARPTSLVGLVTLVLAVGAYSSTRRWIGSEVTSSGGETEFSLTQLLAAATIATLVTLIALLLWRSIQLRTTANDDSIEVDRETDLATGIADRTVFRVGELGGTPPPFLAPHVASDIAEMFGYRAGEPDPATLDVHETIAAHVRDLDSTVLQFERRRELPTVLIVTDLNARARLWHTLPDEFEAAMSSRGVSFESLSFPGSFHRTRAGQRQLRPEGVALENAVAAAGWTVTTVFAEAARLSRTDIAFLKQVGTNGPILFFDTKDSALWDTRHAELAASGVSVLPATAAHLRDALARIFAPDRVTAGGKPPTLGPALSGNADRETLAALMLGDALDWAQDCALVQPVSFALAERLRAGHPKLAGPERQILFSRLAALPGSWVGPEGLRFEPQLRRHLLSGFAARPEDQQAAAAIIDAAFGEEPPGHTENAVWRYARAQVHLLTRHMSDDGWIELEDVRREGLVDDKPIQDFVGRLRTPGQPKDPQAIVLPSEPERGRFRQQLLGDAAEHEANPVFPARWTVGPPEIRVKYRSRSDAPSAQSAIARSPGPSEERSDAVPVEQPSAAFLPDGRVLVYGSFAAADPGQIMLIDAVSLQRHTFARPDAVDAIIDISTAREANVAAFLDPGRQPLVLRPKREAAARAPLQDTHEFERVGDVSLPRDPPGLLVVSPDGEWLVAQMAEEELLLINVASGQQSNRLQMTAAISALSFPQTNAMIVGLRDGTILPIRIEGSMEALSSLGRITGVPTALAAVQPDKPDGPLVIAVEDGRIMLVEHPPNTPGSLFPRSEKRLRWIARRVIPFADRPAARTKSPDRSRGAWRETGLSVAVLGKQGEFDIIGLPAPDDAPADSDIPSFTPLSLLDRDIRPARDWMRVIAVAAQSRRIAVLRAGHIEVRPLTYRPAQAGPVERAAAEAEAEPAPA